MCSLAEAVAKKDSVTGDWTSCLDETPRHRPGSWSATVVDSSCCRAHRDMIAIAIRGEPNGRGFRIGSEESREGEELP